MFDTLTDRFEGIDRLTKPRASRRRRGRRGPPRDPCGAARGRRPPRRRAGISSSASACSCTGAELLESLATGATGHQDRQRGTGDDVGGEPLKISYASRPPTVHPPRRPPGLGQDDGLRQARTAGSSSRAATRLLVGADLQRPAAVEQLRVLGRDIGVTVFSEPSDRSRVVPTAAQGGLAPRTTTWSCLDTAGRLPIDEDADGEVRRISDVSKPHYTFLVIDTMTGQDAVRTAEAFHATLQPRRGDPDQDRRRRPRRRRPVGQAGRRQADRLRRDRRAPRPTSRPSTPSGWRAASSGWATSSP